MRHINALGLGIITDSESFRAKPYLCPAGILTVGYGHVIKSWETFTVISESEASNLLARDVGIAEKGVLRLIKASLSDNQFSSLVSFSFNVGLGGLQRSTLRSKINREEYIEASEEFGKWCRAGGKKLKGLVRRRESERLLFLS